MSKFCIFTHIFSWFSQKLRVNWVQAKSSILFWVHIICTDLKHWIGISIGASIYGFISIIVSSNTQISSKMNVFIQWDEIRCRCARYVCSSTTYKPFKNGRGKARSIRRANELSRRVCCVHYIRRVKLICERPRVVHFPHCHGVHRAEFHHIAH